jgi:hypothetical protein
MDIYKMEPERGTQKISFVQKGYLLYVREKGHVINHTHSLQYIGVNKKTHANDSTNWQEHIKH